MKYVITGAAGHISKPLTETLLKAGHDVTVVGRDEKNLAVLTAQGAKAAIGSVEDANFLTETFKGADAVYTMVPPDFSAADWLAFIGGIGEKYAQAIKSAGVKTVVNLSSIGADKASGIGPVSGLYRVEQALNRLEGVDVLHLRPAYFYQNLLANVGMIKGMGIVGGNFGVNDQRIPMVHPKDIASAAADALQKHDFSGISVRYVVGDTPTMPEVAQVLGTAIGKPDLQWVVFEDEQSLGGMLQAGLPNEIADKYVEMGKAMREGTMQEDFYQSGGRVAYSTKLTDFAEEFKQAYNN